eukprot:s2538_g6.t1
MAAGSVARGRSGLLAGVWLLLTGYDRCPGPRDDIPTNYSVTSEAAERASPAHSSVRKSVCLGTAEHETRLY